MPSTRHKSLRELTDAQAVERARSDFMRSSGSTSRREAQNRRYEKIYQALDPPGMGIDDATQEVDRMRRRSRANNYLPIGATLVETAVSQLYQALFGIPRYFKVQLPDEEDYLFQEEIVQHMLKRHREMGFKDRCEDAILQACCYDYSVSFMRWDLQWGYQPKRKKTQTRVPGGLKQKVTVEQEWVPDAIDRPTMDVLNFFDCFPDPDSKRDFTDSTFFGDKRREPFEDLKRQEKSKKQPHGRYKNIGMLLEAIDDVDSIADGTKEQTLGTRQVPIHRYWTFDQVFEYVPISGNDGKEGIVIRRLDTSGWALKLWKLFKKPGSFPGMGLLQRLERIQLDINASANAIRDFQNLISDPIAIASLELLELEEGDIELDRKVYTVASGETKDKLHFAMPGIDISQGGAGQIQFMENFARKISPIGGENQGGAFMSGRRSAREVGAVGAGTDTKKFQIADRWTNTVVGPLLNDQFALEQQNMTKGDAVVYMGPQGEVFRRIDPLIYKTNSVPIFMMEGPTYMMFEDLKKSQFITASQLGFQVAPELQDKVEWNKILWTMFAPEDAHRLMADPNKNNVNVPADNENFMLAKGQSISVSPLNDHAEHIAIHTAIKTTADYRFWWDSMRAKLDQHISEHQQAATQAVAGALRPSQGFQDGSDALRGLSAA